MFPRLVRRMLFILFVLFVGSAFAAGLPAVLAGKIDATTWDRVADGELRDLIVVYRDAVVESEAAVERSRRGVAVDDQAILGVRAARYREIKDLAHAVMSAREFEVRKDYSHVPASFMRFESVAALRRLMLSPEVVAVVEDIRVFPTLAESLPLIGQPPVAGVIGRSGTGTVAVLDTGVDYTLSAFGSCSAPGGDCSVVFAQDFATEDNLADAGGHGTTVAATVLGVAPGTKIAALDVFDGSGAYSSDIIEAINWAISNRATYDIVAINMSLGGSTKYTSACNNNTTNPFRPAIVSARNAGIAVVVSSGNDGYTDGVSIPACTGEAVSVGAVYDANVGGVTWSACTDSTTAADKVTCFSNSASFMTMLAPGALITAVGSTVGGTSFSAPMVAGAVAVMAEAFPSETVTTRIARLTGSATSVTDARNGIAKPRLNLLAAQGAPENDAFAAASVISGNSGQATGWNYNASKESSEPAHAGGTGGASVWWQWTAPASGTLTVDTQGSGIDTLLAAYTGDAVAALAAVASSDDDGSSGGVSSVSFDVEEGVIYRLAVDGKSATSGALTLNWSLLRAQNIAFASIADQPVGASVVLSATASSGLAVTFASLTPMICTVSGSSATMVAAGLCSIAATQTGNAEYLPATDAVQGFTVHPVVAGVCGAANGQFYASAPTSDLCAAGTASAVSGSGPWTWTCEGSGGGGSAACFASLSTSGSGGDDDDHGDVPIPLWALVLLGAGLVFRVRKAG